MRTASSTRSDEIEFTVRQTLGLYSSDGEIYVLVGHLRSRDYPTQPLVIGRKDDGYSAAMFCYWAIQKQGNSWHRFGYTSIDVDQQYLFPIVKIAVFPHWFATIALVILPAKWLLTRISKRRHLVSGRCTQCGYDLRASQDRCPECGSAIPEKVKPQSSQRAQRDN